MWLDGDDATVPDRLSNASIAFLKTLVAENNINKYHIMSCRRIVDWMYQLLRAI